VQYELMAIAREAIANVLRHGHATKIWFSLRYERRSVTLLIRDNGEGFDPDRDAGLGIQGMRQRAEDMGANLQIQSRRGEGTLISIQTPYGRRLSLMDWLRFLRLRLFSRRN
jgi:signal transduction histidine kinase